MSKKFYNRKEFLIIVGGFTTLMGMISWIKMQEEKNKSQSNNRQLTNNQISPNEPSPSPVEKLTTELTTEQKSINTYILERNVEKKEKKDVHFHKIFNDKDPSYNIELLKINKQPDFIMGASPEINSSKTFDYEKAKEPTPIEKDFYMSRYPITQKQWQALMGDNPSTFQDEYRDEPGLPVETVSWEDAQKFCAELTRKTGKTYRLPKEKEWEYACRANTPNQFFFYFGNDLVSGWANYDASKPGGLKSGSTKYYGKTTPVDKYPANSFGLQDMHGNVWEWCSDSWDKEENEKTYEEANQKPDGPRATIRGGAWHSFQPRCHIFSREFIWKNVKSNRIGFRVVCEEV